MAEDKTSVIGVAEFRAASAISRSACFIVIAGPEVGRMYKLDRDELIIGRIPEVAIQVQDTGVSRRHAKIVRRSDGTVELVDLQSTNGTICNGEKVESRVLSDGDKIQVGATTILKFSYQDDLEEEFQRRQYESAVRDALTQCYNKKYFLERLPSDMAFARRHQSALSLGMMDIDHFKRVNDTYGHQAGDVVLRTVAKVVQDSIRADDMLSRYGGEEFTLIMRNTSLPEAAIAAGRIRQKVEDCVISCGGQTIRVTISIGIAVCLPDGTDDPEALIQAADTCLYSAKNAGRNRVVVQKS